VFGPGAYRPDPTEGMTAIADRPQPEMVPYSRNDIRNACPRCGHVAYRDKQPHRTLHDLGHLDGWCPRDLVLTYAQHDCTKEPSQNKFSKFSLWLSYPMPKRRVLYTRGHAIFGRER
jgi:hypothetical protein